MLPSSVMFTSVFYVTSQLYVPFYALAFVFCIKLLLPYSLIQDNNGTVTYKEYIGTYCNATAFSVVLALPTYSRCHTLLVYFSFFRFFFNF